MQAETEKADNQRQKILIDAITDSVEQRQKQREQDAKERADAQNRAIEAGKAGLSVDEVEAGGEVLE